MKIKLNNRLMRIGLGCIIIALLLTSYLYRNIKRAAAPEQTIKIAHFGQNIIKNTILEDRDIEMLEVPISRVPDGALQNKSTLVGKRLIVDANKGEYAFLNKVTERGDIKIDVEDMWVIGLDVKDISNFMGIQLKSGEYYGLIYQDTNGALDVRHLVKIVSLIDNVGKEIFSNGEGVAKTINIAIETKEELLAITTAKHSGFSFEIIKTPAEWGLDS